MNRRFQRRVADLVKQLGYTPLSIVRQEVERQPYERWLIIVFPDFDAAFNASPHQAVGEGRVIGEGASPKDALTQAERTVRRLLVGRIGGSRVGDGPWWVTA